MASTTGRTSRRPVVGVTGNDKWWSPSWYCIRLSVFLAGGVARRISHSRRFPVDALDAIVISGGDDIHPTIFGEEAQPQTFYDHDRDELEQAYIRDAMERNLPMLGICRGHQLINALLGGSLHLNIREMRSKTHNRPGLLATKTVMIAPGSRLQQILGRERIRVNSLHYQAVKELAPDLDCEARDLDDFCQAAALAGKDILGVQWHPEYMFYLSTQRKLFRWLVRAAR
ncbi:gamma-glutamyl-gamma-aminobutyrate hydrolase family protein [Seongchinamella sediminis]|uniref:Gamma-glutamyl-gamma-aminobutyrate hydrolase family protein n=1 Tax=Seongchinamella sediminis TaxID=2283635 RepID=A0A3L7DW19_9GAMM|nr:gamma-glutamyl-gamma-aminobutyrate hydrolase family protein [Seongchinamella sediminis]RLQ21778.1 gamma-glutamyl-gamma-aminobutyrate hydrolase family protein [Seongchinamella sediminis]